MIPARSNRWPSFITLAMQSLAMRWLAVVLLSPLLALGTFAGAEFLAHQHDDHGTHFHATDLDAHRKLAALSHAADHGHHHPADLTADGDPTSVEGELPPPGVVVAVPDQEQIPSRSLDLCQALSRASVCLVSLFLAPHSPDLDRHIGSPGGRGDWDPQSLCALRTGDRLVRTSRALLL